MALIKRTIAKRLFTKTHTHYSSSSPEIQPNTSPDHKSFFRRFLQRRSINQSSVKLPEFLSVPVGDKLREKLWPITYISTGNRFRFDGLSLSPPVSENLVGISVDDVKKIIRLTKLEKVRFTMRNIPANSISYSEFVRICSEVCENGEQGLECAKMMDEAGNVIILGKTVFLRPDQVAKSMEKLIYESIATPNDPRKKELEKLEKQKEIIDRKAESLVRAELYSGLGFMVIQTLGFMRLTFWELSWDVMEPICFFVTSLHFALAYVFFLRTSKEPTFEGFFQRRFKAKQRKLVKLHKFDVQKYSQLCQAFYPSCTDASKFGNLEN